MPTVVMLCLLSLCALPASAADPAPLRAFPLLPLADDGLGGTRLALDPASHQALEGLPAARLTGLVLGDGRAVDLSLGRVQVADADTVVALDRRPLPHGERLLTAGLSLWSGTVVGEPDSDVYLAFSASGSRGWIRHAGGVEHLLAGPGADGRWTTSTSRLVDEAWMQTHAAPRGPVCATDVDLLPPDVAGGPLSPPSAGPGDGAASNGVLYECRMAIETDTQFHDLFGDLDAAAAYLGALWGAVSDRYRSEVGTVITLAYVNFWSGPDVWVTQETPDTNMIDLLYEFRDAWDGGAAPVDADLFHFTSGSGLGGGVAYRGTVCHKDLGFGVSANIGADLPLPLMQGPLNWDFVVSAHETGHNFGTTHTHSYCPPLDECSPDGYWGDCQDEQLCTEGTIMSYCHLCDGGIANIRLEFHPDVKQVMRDFIEDRSCLQPFDGVFVEDLGLALAGTAGEPLLEIGFAAPDVFQIDVGGAPGSTNGALVVSPTLLQIPLMGGTLVPDLTLLLPVTTSAGGGLDIDAVIPADVELPEGLDLFLQAWFPDAGAVEGWTASNGVRAELILGAAWPDPVWFAHPGNGLEYALSSPGSFDAARAQALGLGGDLASVPDQALHDWLVTTFAGMTPEDQAYIGYSDEAVEGAWVWTDGTPSGFEAWDPGQPNNLDESGQDHAVLWFDSGTWNDSTGSGWDTNRALMQRPQAP